MIALLTLSALAPLQTPVPPRVISFFGRDGFERIQGLHFDEASKKVFAAGHSRSDLQVGFGPLPGHDQVYDGKNDGFVARFSKDLRNLEAWTFVGAAFGSKSPTPGDDRVYTVGSDESGDVYVYGFSSTPEFFTDPTVTVLGGPLQGRRDVFLARYSNDLQRVRWILRLGGDAMENANLPAAELEQGRNTLYVRGDGTCFVSGGTNNPDFFDGHVTPVVPHVIAQQQPNVVNRRNFDAFVARVAPDGTVQWGTFFGGDGDESAYSGIAVRRGAVIVAGNVNEEDTLQGTANTGLYWGQNGHVGSGLPGTDCAPGPSACRFQRRYQGGAHSIGGANGFHHIVGGDGFLARFDASTGALAWATYLGGSGFDEISGNEGFTVGPNGRLYVAGATESADFPMASSGPPAFDGALNASGDFDGFVAVLDANATGLVHSTLLGGEGTEELGAIAVDPLGFVYVGGNTSSGATRTTGFSTAPYPTTLDAFQCRNYQTYKPGAQVPETGMLTKLYPTLSGLAYSTYFGGSTLVGGGRSDHDRIRTAFWKPGGWCYLAGDTNSADLASIHSTPGACPQLPLGIPTGNGSVSALHPANTGTQPDGFLARIELGPERTR